MSLVIPQSVLDYIAKAPDGCRPTACAHCPSARSARIGQPDPETEDIKTCSRRYQLDSVFKCAWSDNVLCKGYCDELKVTPEEMRSVIDNWDERDGDEKRGGV